MSAATAGLENEQEKLEVRAKMVWQNMRDHFGDIKLSMSEIQAISKQIVWGDDVTNFDQFNTAVQTAEASLKTLKSASEDTNRWLWKSSLGIKFTDDEKESVVASFDEYITSALNYAENKHYEYTAAVSLLVDVGSGVGKSIITTGNAFYASIKDKLNSLGTKLTGQVEIALQDGIITLNEHDEIVNLQNQIAEITAKLANAETEAELELIKVKFGEGKLDLASFETFMEQMSTTLEERIAANDEAFTASVAGLNLQLAEGAITQAEYDKQLAALTAGYEAKIDEVKAKVMDVELEIIGDAYAKELGADAASKLKNALESAMTTGIDPINWTTDQVSTMLGVTGLSESSAEAISTWLSAVYAQLAGIGSEVAEYVPGTIDTTMGLNIVAEPVIQDRIEILVEDFGVEPQMAAAISVLLTAEPEVLNKLPINGPGSVAEAFNIPDEIAYDVLLKLYNSKSIEERVKILASDFGIPEDKAASILWRLTGQKSIMNTISLGAGDFGIMNRYSFSPTVDIFAKTGTVTLPTINLRNNAGKGSGYRGGIFGGDSAMDAFARGGLTDNGGIVGGSTRFIRVNEESPEMIIPLSSQRRERALKLFNKTGELLDVPGFARGGNTVGGQDEGIRFSTYGNGGDAASGRTVQVNMGGIKLEINVSGSDQQSIAEAIKAQAGELADYIAGQIAEALSTEFENTPVRGGVA